MRSCRHPQRAAQQRESRGVGSFRAGLDIGLAVETRECVSDAGMTHHMDAVGMSRGRSFYGLLSLGRAEMIIFRKMEQKRAPDFIDLIESSLNRSEEHTSELQSLMRISYAVFCLKKKKTHR